MRGSVDVLADGALVSSDPPLRGLLSRFGGVGAESTTRVVVLTAEGGEGHLAAAKALVADLVADGDEVDVVVLDALTGLGSPLRALCLHGYRLQLRLVPWSYGAFYWLFSRVGTVERLGRLGLTILGGRRLQRYVDAWQPDIVVSTYPAATSVLGDLRRRNRLEVPVYATITDMGGLAFWVHEGVDAHLVMHESCLNPVERIAGDGSALLCRPLVAPAFFEPLSKTRARRQLGLDHSAPVIVVSGGGWGAGDILGAVRVALSVDDATVVCVAGRSERLRRRLEAAFAEEPQLRVLGFTEQMNELLAAADVLVHSTGGVTCLEALVRRCPVIAYGAPPGHARLTAERMAALGLARNARSSGELMRALRESLAARDACRAPFAAAPRAATIITGSPCHRAFPGRRTMSAAAMPALRRSGEVGR